MRKATADLFAYSRGKTLIVMTNREDQKVTSVITYLPFSKGEVICNIFNLQDCLQVSHHGVMVNLDAINGETYKIYV